MKQHCMRWEQVGDLMEEVGRLRVIKECQEKQTGGVAPSIQERNAACESSAKSE